MFANGLSWFFCQTRFRKINVQPRPYAKTKVLEAFRALSLGFYIGCRNQYKTAARMRKISCWSQKFEFQEGIQGVFDGRARKVIQNKILCEVGKNEVERRPNESLKIMVSQIYSFLQKLNFIMKPDHNKNNTRKEDTELEHFTTKPQPESNLSPKAYNIL